MKLYFNGLLFVVGEKYVNDRPI